MARQPCTVPVPNLLDLIPVRCVDCEELGDGRAVLLRPKFVHGPLARWLQPHLRRPFYRVHLDEVGTFIWNQIDGSATIDAIAQAARDHFGEAIEPVYDRLRLFLQQLEQGHFIQIPRDVPVS